MTDPEFELKKKQICDFRHSVVAELGNPYLSRGKLTQLIKEKSGREYAIPYSKRKTLTEGCIRRWLNLYRKYGKEGLAPGVRDDRGKSRLLKDAQQTALIHLLETRPEITATAAVKILQTKGIIQNEISSSSLSRFIKSHGLTYRERNRNKEAEKSLKFDFFSPLECIQVDVMYGPQIPDEKGKYRKALLMAFLDDATRRIIYSRFSFSEKSILFEDGIKHILKTHGMIGRLYTDNGSSFVSNQTNHVHPILIIDEADKLGNDILQEIRLIANFNYDSYDAITILLCGQENLLQKFGLSILESLANSVTVTVRINTLKKEETYSYIEQRISDVSVGNSLFTKAAMNLIHNASGGVMRVINNMGEHSMIKAYLSGSATVEKEHVQAILSR